MSAAATAVSLAPWAQQQLQEQQEGVRHPASGIMLLSEVEGDEAGKSGLVKAAGEWAGCLPEELWVLILAGLPLPDVARARCVCRAWNSMWYSPSFRNVVQLQTRKVPWAVFFPLVQRSDAAFRGYDVETALEQRLPPPPLSNERVAGAKGFLCGFDAAWDLDAGAGHPQEVRLLIGNPLTQCRTQLPPLSVSVVHIVWLQVQDSQDSSQDSSQEANTASFAACVAGWTEEEMDAAVESFTAYVYLSWKASHSWYQVKLPPAYHNICGFAVLDRRLHFFLRHEATNQDVVALYDPEAEEWCPDPVPPPDGFSWFAKIVECGGKLYGIAAHALRSFFLLALDLDLDQDPPDAHWKVVRRFPEMHCPAHQDGCPLVVLRDAIATQDGRLCITLEHSNPSLCKLLVYDNVVSDKDDITWHTLPLGVYERDPRIALFGAYEPSFASLPKCLG